TAPILRLDPAALAFGAQPLGTVADPKPLVVHNDGTAALDLHDIAIGGENAAEFTLVTDSATGAHLNPGDTATFTLRFTPTATGSRTAVLTLNDPADHLHPTVALAGTGTEASVSISPASLDFGAQMLGTAGNSQTVLLQNTGDAPLSVGSVTLAGANPADFTIIADGWSGERLLPGQVATLNLRFTPTAAGARAAVLTVSDDAAGSPQTVALAGTGTAPVGGLDTSSVSFADQLVGTTSAEQMVTLTNSGNALLALVAVSLAGANAADFAAVLDTGNPTL